MLANASARRPSSLLPRLLGLMLLALLGLLVAVGAQAQVGPDIFAHPGQAVGPAAPAPHSLVR